MMEPSFHLKMVEFFVKFSLSGAKRSVNRVKTLIVMGQRSKVESKRCEVYGQRHMGRSVYVCYLEP